MNSAVVAAVAVAIASERLGPEFLARAIGAAVITIGAVVLARAV